MHFTLKNLGRLEEATIDLGQDLILLTGRNNTSKTYVAHAVYGFASGMLKPLMSSMFRLIPEDVIAGGTIKLDLVRLVRENMGTILEEIVTWYKATLPDIFAAEEAFVSRAKFVPQVDAKHLEKWSTAFIQSDYSRHNPNEVVIATKEAGSSILTFALQPALTADGIIPNYHEHEGRLRHYSLLTEAQFRAIELIGQLFLPLNSYILTAERSAIQLFSRELSLNRSDLVDELLAKTLTRGSQDLSSMLGRRARRYSLPIRDGLKTADDLATLAKSKSSYAPFADRLERDILEGSVRVSEGGEMRFHPEASQASLEMHLTSSSVKSLSPLSFYLRHLAHEGQLLIIDEPELNLHPDNQRYVARLLVRLARAGLKVMISTHSDYVIREINNAIMLSADTTGALREKYGYEEQDTIRPERVGAYLFEATRARPIPVEPTGISVKSIDDEINRLNQSSQDIYYALFDEPKGA